MIQPVQVVKPVQKNELLTGQEEEKRGLWQRVPRYKMLVDELRKNTAPQHLDYADLTQLLSSLGREAAQINESIRANEMTEACPSRGYWRAGTQNDRLGKSFPTVRSTCLHTCAVPYLHSRLSPHKA